MILLIKATNTDNATKLRVGNTLTEKVRISICIRQGDSLSPILYNLVIDQLIHDINDRVRGHRKRR